MKELQGAAAAVAAVAALCKWAEQGVDGGCIEQQEEEEQEQELWLLSCDTADSLDQF